MCLKVSSITAVLHCCDIVFVFYVSPDGLVDSETWLYDDIESTLSMFLVSYCMKYVHD